MDEINDEEEIFFRASQHEPGVDRDRYLDEACAADPGLRQRIEGLLQAHDAPADILSEADIGKKTLPGESLPSTSPDFSGSERPGDRIGAYELIEQIGSGGMGTVWRAEQRAPIRRLVALKIIKLGMDTAEVGARFGAERQALAMMNHPGIAKVYDAGATNKGRPFFVMELVEGKPITEFCDEARMDTAERLALFAEVCRAVQHAHQKGVIHRDIKPTNILVAEQDGKPVAKVIDFGIAKAVDEKLSDWTLMTKLGQVVGTLGYMSPEQAGCEADIDTRSDIYSLGVVLYELISGHLPIEPEQFKQLAIDSVLKAIREEEPPKPSTRLSGLGEQGEQVAKRRSSGIRRLTQSVTGELDWIVMKALEKDRNRRYETANGLALDIQRLLNNEPVAAGPPSVFYRLHKFARRNFVAISASAVLLLMAPILTSATYLAARQAITKNVHLHLEVIADQQQTRLGSVLGRNFELLDQFIGNPALVENLVRYLEDSGEDTRDSLNFLLRAANDSVVGSTEVYILDHNGKVIGSSNLDDIDCSMAEMAFYVERGLGNPNVHAASFSVDSSGLGAVYSTLIPDKDGYFLGLIAMVTSGDDLSEASTEVGGVQTLLAKSSEGSKHEILILAPPGRAGAIAATGGALNMAVDGKAGFFPDILDDLRDVRVMAVTRHLGDQESGLGFVTQMDHSEAFSDLRKVKTFSWAITAVYLSTGIGVLLLILRRSGH